ncbi:MAG: response regulator transcription factor [Thermoanaerobaculia bacterium]|nr:response regulator transcription factor [Thermoanaerobaculia bacterium]
MTDVDSPLVAVVEDEESLRETLSFALRKEGFRVSVYADGRSAWDAFQEDLPDLAVLDILMPRMDGLELCRRIRGLSEVLPIVFLTSRDEEFDRVLGLELGADDYLCKPFSMRELVARIKVLFRRVALSREDRVSEDLLEVGPLVLDRKRFRARWRGEELSLTVTEFRILLALGRHPGHVKTREQLLSEGYPHDHYVSDRTIDTHIKRIRKKMTAVDPAFEAIETVYGLGYRYREPRD